MVEAAYVKGNAMKRSQASLPRLRVGLTILVLAISTSFYFAQVPGDDWTAIPVPGAWEDAPGGKFAKYDGYAWYRCFVKVPATWKGDDLSLTLHNVDNTYEAFFNGVKIGHSGSFPPGYLSGATDRPASYTIEAALVRPGEANHVAVRVYDHNGPGGFKGAAPLLSNETQAIGLKGDWLFRTGDDLNWAKLTGNAATFLKVEDAAAVLKRYFPEDKTGVATGPSSPAEALKKFTIPADLDIELLLSEPIVGQPVFINFDERGRMWVVQYLQYPNPAGLKIVSRDKYWRNVYDKVPAAPPNHVRGKDKITIHEDTDGDGKYDKHTTFVDGLNMTTAVTRGRGGVWVLNPPYLLFYPDKNNDDVPDGDPQVHLAGFGLEDTHSITNSLHWGPDGWLYAAQGSTVSGSIVRPGLDKTPVHSMGQHIWRYHPESKRYEIFAEGGGNAFGVEIDSKGRVYSGHNGGNTRGFHYVQGGHYQKSFGKHGALSNPYAFGFFQPMTHAKVPRFTHTFAINEGGALPARYQGKLFGVAPLLNHVVCSDISPDGSSFQTKDIEHTVASSDVWFRPVDIKLGPDGAVYIADWYDSQIAHFRTAEGQFDPSRGRIYRLKAKGASPIKTPDFARLPTGDLIERLHDKNRWVRETALRVLGDRKHATAVPLLLTLRESTGQTALESLWAIHLSDGLDQALALEALNHRDPYVRLWTVRLLGDHGKVSASLTGQLVSLAHREQNVEVRSQLACSARRLPADVGLAIVRELLPRNEDADDIHMPLLLWWAIESKAESDRAKVLALFADSSLWQMPLVEKHILERVMRRYAQAGKRSDLLVCAELLRMAPAEKQAQILLTGFEKAFAGRSLANLPEELLRELAKRGGGSLSLQLRLGQPEAVENALNLVADERGDSQKRRELVQILGEIKETKALPLLLQAVSQSKDDGVRRAALAALQSFNDPVIADRLVALQGQFTPELRSLSQSVLLARKEWTRSLLEAVEAKSIQRDAIALDVVRKMTVHRDERIGELVSKHWGKVAGATTAEMQKKIAALQGTLGGGAGSPYHGKALFTQSCAKCHTLFAQGGQIGPDLTAYKRDDLANMLAHIVNPSVEIREGFETHILITDDGRVLTGFLVDQDNRIVILRTAEGNDVSVPRTSVEDMRVLPQSIMPEGLLDNLADQQVRDLFAYLRSTQPLND